MDKSIAVDIEGHRLAVVLSHSGNSDIPVFFLHGIGASIYFWQPELTCLFHHLGPCYSLSLPGHFPAIFPKDFPSECFTGELIARLIAGAVQEIAGNNQVLLVGHSTGGFAAICTAIYYPEVVAGLVSIAGFSKGQWTGALGFNQWLVRHGRLGRDIFKTIYRLGGLHPTIFRMYWQIYANDHGSLLGNRQLAAVTNCMLPYFRKLDRDALVHYFAVMPRTDVTPDLAKINVPACVIAGDTDPIVPPKQSEDIAESIANSTLVKIGGAGHLPFFERPVEYTQAIVDWLAEFRCMRGSVNPFQIPL